MEEQRNSLAELQDTVNRQRDQHDRVHVVEPTDVPATDDTPQTEPVSAASSSSNSVRAQHTLIIGDSMIKDIQEKGLVKTTVKCLRGGRMANINAELTKINLEQYSAIVVHGGTNDCVSDAKLTEGSTHYKELIESIRNKAPSTKLIISTICPRVDDTRNNERVQQFNRNLRMLAREKGCVLVDNDGNFYLRNDEVDTDNLTAKGLHLSKVGTRKLLMNINKHQNIIPRKDTASSAVAKDNTATTSTTSRRHRPQYAYRRQGYGIPQDNKTRHRRQEHHADFNRDTRCRFCGLSNHTTSECNHRRPVQCHDCREFGHKSYQPGRRPFLCRDEVHVDRMSYRHERWD